MRTTTSIVKGNLFKLSFQHLQDAAGDEAIEAHNKEIRAARKRLSCYAGIPVIIIIVSLLLMLLFLGSRPKPFVPGENELLLCVPSQCALQEFVSPGSVVQLYCTEGSVPSLRYVQVAAIRDDSLVLILTERQLKDYLGISAEQTVYPVPVYGIPANEAITLQQSWNTPAITLAMPQTMSLSVGDTVNMDLKMTLTPQEATRPAVSWKSSDERVLTVTQNGSVTAHRGGKATISATADGVTAQCNIIVLINAEELTFSDSEFVVSQGQGLQLELIADPEDTSEDITWTSSDESVLSVDQNGFVTAHKGGSATITAMGAYATGSCKVVVTVPAERVVLSKSRLKMEAGATQQLAGVVMPEEATDKTLTWESNCTDVAKVAQDGTVSAVAPGEALIVVRCGDAKAECVIEVEPIPEQTESAKKD